MLGGQVPFSKVLYIESSDFRLKDSKDYYGLAPGKSVLLRLVQIYICDVEGSLLTHVCLKSNV